MKYQTTYQVDEHISIKILIAIGTDTGTSAIPSSYNRMMPLRKGEDDDWWSDIRYFSRKEFACKRGRHCDGYPVQMQRSVVELADRALEELKGVGFVSSGLRCSQHNANVGGVSDSRHLSGKAIDLRIGGKSAKQTLDWAQKQPEVRYAYAIDAYCVHITKQFELYSGWLLCQIMSKTHKMR